MKGLLRILCVFCLVGFAPLARGFSLTDEAEEKAEFVEGLKRDIIKVDHSIAVTKDLIKKSKGAPYLPDIVFRLAELYVERSRQVYYLEIETKGADQAIKSPEAQLLKGTAIEIYKDIMHRFPDYRYNDKVLFVLGHEYLELGMHQEMLDSYQKLVDDYPKSALLLEALYIVGEYYFNRDDLAEAEKRYTKILEYRESPIHDMSRYKLGWIAINNAKVKEDKDKKEWKRALSLFEQVATSQNSPDEGITVDTYKSINIKVEAIDAIVFCFTEVHSPKIALEYFLQLANSNTVYVHALEKLANRYFIKEQYDNAAMMFRRIIELSNDVEKNLDYAQRIYDASAYSKNKEKVDEDVSALVKAASRYAFSWRIPDEEKKQLAKEFEVYARDIVTKLHQLSKQREEKRSFRITAQAYRNYLSFFDYTEKLTEIKYNYAESLYLSDQFIEAGRAYEDIARNLQESKDRKEALYSSIQAYQYALGDVKYLNKFGRVEARQALKQLGAYFVSKYPQDPQTPTIKFNVARMFYDQGEYKQAIESFLEYMKQYPSHSEVKVAGHLVLDCYKQLEDFKGLAQQGRAFIADGTIRDEQFKKEVEGIVSAAENQAIDKKTLEVSAEGKDAATALLDYASEVDAGQAENVIYRSFVIAKEKRNIQLAFQAGGQLAKQYPSSKYLQDIYATLGHFSAAMADFERAAALYEDFYKKFPQMTEAREAMQAAAKFHTFLGDNLNAIKDLRILLEGASGEKRGLLQVDIADAYASMDDWRMVLSEAKQAVADAPGSVKGQLLYAKALEKLGKREEAKQTYMAAASSGGPEDLVLSSEAQFRLGEMLLEDYRQIRFGAGQDDQSVLQNKMQMIQSMEGIYAGVVEMKEPTWAIASLFRLYQVYQDFADFLKSAPVPADLNAEQKKQYQQAFAEQVQQQAETAKTYLDTCAKTVQDKKVFGPFALACIKKREPVADKGVSRRRGSPAGGKQVDELKTKLLQNPNDLKTLDDLAMLSIYSGDFHMARLVLTKALEVNENHAASLNLMGLVELNLGEDQDAYQNLKKAMDTDGKLFAARLNLAALFMSYGDETRARAVLSPILGQVKTADLSTPDIHRSVKDVLTELRIR